VIVPDSSVLVAGFFPDHPLHDLAGSALAIVRLEGRLVAHTVAETYAVLSSPGGVHRADAVAVVTYLKDFLGESEPIVPRPSAYREALDLLSREGRGGGSIYDALIALTARDADATLVSLDRRAKPIYELCGADVRFLDAA
jgi:toxin FitB